MSNLEKHGERNTENQHPAEHASDAAGIQSRADNTQHAKLKQQQGLRSFKITGVNVDTGQKQESFSIVDGTTEHKDSRPARRDTATSAHADSINPQSRETPQTASTPEKSDKQTQATSWLSKSIGQDIPSLETASAELSRWIGNAAGEWESRSPSKEGQLAQLKPSESPPQGRNKDDEPSDVGWSIVDQHKEPPATNQILEHKNQHGYNCKYYVKTFIEGHEPVGEKEPRNCEIDANYLASKNYKKQDIHGVNELKEGDVVFLKTPYGSLQTSSAIHAAVVMRDKDGHLYLIQKPDPDSKIQKCNIRDFANHFSNYYTENGNHPFSIPGPYFEVYRHS